MYFKPPATAHSISGQTGYSLLELMAVIIILGVIALAVIPGLSTSTPQRLDLAAQKYAEAIRYARSESMRGSKLYGVSQGDTNRVIRVLSIDQSTIPWAMVKDVYHPSSKKIYDIYLKDLPGMSGVTTQRDTLFRAACNTSRKLYFDKHGAAWCLDPHDAAVIEFKITFLQDGQARILTLNGPTGRVTIQ